MSRNFLRAYSECKIETADGKEWLFNAPEHPYYLGCSIVTKMVAGGFGVPTITASFTAPYEEAIKIMEGGLFRNGNRFGVRIGYVGDDLPTPWYSGALTAGGDGLRMTAEGLEGGVTIQCVAPETWNTQKPWGLTGMDGFSVYEATARRLGCKFVPSAGAEEQIWAVHAGPEPDPDAFNNAGFTWAGAPSGRNAWDWLQFLNQTFHLTTTIAFDYLGERLLYVVTEAEAKLGVMQSLEGVPDVEIPERTYRLRGLLNPKTGEYPCISWGPDQELAQWDGMPPPGGGGGVEANAINPATGSVIHASSTPEEQASPVSTGVETPNALEDPWNDTGVKEYSVSNLGFGVSVPAPPGPTPEATDDASIEQELKKVARDRQGEGNPAQKGTIATIGIPEEFCGNIINLQGCSKRYNGRYQIWGLTQTYAGGIWDMTLSVLRQGYGKDGTNAEEKVPLEGTIPEAP